VNSAKSLMKSRFSIILLIVFSFIGCNSYIRHADIPTEGINPSVSNSEFMSVQQVFNELSARKIADYKNGPIPIHYGSDCKVIIESEKLACSLVSIEGISDLKVISYVVSDANENVLLFYPVITAYSRKQDSYVEILPEYELDINGTVLENTFKLPKTTTHILIHTRKRYIGMQFPIENDGDYGNDYLAITGLIIGGAIGGAIYAANSGQMPNNTEYTLSQVGYIEISHNKPN